MTRLLCFLLGHRPPHGLDRKWSMYFCCARCRRVVKGGLWVAR